MIRFTDTYGGHCLPGYTSYAEALARLCLSVGGLCDLDRGEESTSTDTRTRQFDLRPHIRLQY